MKLIHNFWTLMAALALAALTLTACGEDAGDESAPPGGDSEDITNPAFMELLCSDTWSGKCVTNLRNPRGTLETLDVRFLPDGTGAMTYHANRTDETHDFQFSFHVVRNKFIVCNGSLIKNGEMVDADYELRFTYDEKMLYPIGDFSQFILCIGTPVNTLPSGEIYPFRFHEEVQKIWINEDGVSILDLRDFDNAQFVQLTEPDSKEYKLSYDGRWEWVKGERMGFTYKPEERYVTYFDLIDLSEEKMVVKRGKRILTFYPCNESKLPQPTDNIALVLTAPDRWSYSSGYYYYLKLEKGGKCRIDHAFYYEAKGTYQLQDNRIDFDFNEVGVPALEATEGGSFGGFTHGLPRQISTTVKIHSLNQITLNMPEIGTITLRAQYEEKGEWFGI